MRDMNELTYTEISAIPAKDVYRAMFAQVNGPGHRFEDAVREEFTKEHGTIQQAMIQHVVRPMLEVLAKEYKDGLCDPRNLHAGAFAARALEATADVPLPTI